MHRLVVLLVLFSFLATSALAQTAARGVSGIVRDPLGAPVAGATVALLRDGERVAETRTAADGTFSFTNVQAGRYAIDARADGFAAQTGEPFFLGANGAYAQTLTLQVGVEQAVVVTASAVETPVSQTGASVSVIDRGTIDALAKADVLEALRLVPGVSVAQLGGRGALTSLFVRGGASNFNKVLIDGVPVNDIGGAFDFSTIATTGIERVEVLRNANSVAYGADALAGVVSLTSRRGRTRIPELSVSVDGGTLGTHREEASVGGAAGRVDYFASLSAFRTDNDVPNNAFENTTFASRLGFQIASGSEASVSVRHTAHASGSPNAIRLFGIADDSTSNQDATYVSASLSSRVSRRWRASGQFSSMAWHYRTNNPSPSGDAYDPFGFGANYLGNTVTITGANGYSTTGRAILDFGATYPTPYDARTERQAASGTLTGTLAGWLDVTAGARVEREDGVTQYSTFDPSRSARTNSGVFAEGRVAFRRAFVAAGIGYDHHAVFESEVTPRVSVAVYLRDPSSTLWLGETKVTVNAGKGIKAPRIDQELSSLFAVVPADVRPVLAPIGPERNRSVDVGVEQGLWRGRARARAAYFDNRFTDLIEFVSSTVLPRLGVSPEAAAASGFGAYVNSSSYRARGVEVSADVTAGPHLTFMASYTHLDAVVDESLADAVLTPAINPAFPATPIGAYGPLKGARPFRRPENSGNLLASFTRGPAQVTLSAYFSGKSDDSTFLLDPFFGNSMLLPNRDLVDRYQKVDLSGSYQIHPRLRWHASVENLLNQDYAPAFGFPALPLTFRSGLSVTLGGDRRP